MKTKKADKDDMIHGEEICPTLEEDNSQKMMTSIQIKWKILREPRNLGLSEYELGEIQICWIKLYGHIQVDLEEEDVVDEVDGCSTGTGAYLSVMSYEIYVGWSSSVYLIRKTYPIDCSLKLTIKVPKFCTQVIFACLHGVLNLRALAL
jgi:hypothetical protein